MSVPATLPRRAAATIVAAGLLVACERGGDDPAAAGADVDRGGELFTANCAVCHGDAADGTASGPPLVHEVYEPSHHGDESFQVAVARGVQPHHWEFGPMPPIAGLDRDDVADITAWVRERQREAGIE